MACYLINSNSKGLSSAQLAEQIGITQKYLWLVLQGIKKTCKTKDFNMPLQEIYEIDEAYLSVREGNTHAAD